MEELVPRNARIGQTSRLSTIPFDTPAQPFTERSWAGAGEFHPTRPGDRVLDPLQQIAPGVAAASLGGWGAAELIDPFTEAPEEVYQRREPMYEGYLDYAEFRNRAMRLHLNGVRSWAIRRDDPEMAAELARIENDSGVGRTLEQSYQGEPPPY
jgi:hypothetical protein